MSTADRIEASGSRRAGRRRLWTFPGGIHPPEHKDLSNGAAIRDAGIPEVLVLPLRQHIGADAEPCVRAQDHVLKGELIATPGGPVSAGVHAPTSGVIRVIEERRVPHPSGLTDVCIVLEADGEDRWCPRHPIEDWRAQDPAVLRERVRDAGIAGLGGAGFPTATKLGGARDGTLHTLILNGVECEPYITADDVLMRERAPAIVVGAQILMRISGTSTCVIAVEDNKPESAAAIDEAIEALGVEDVELVVIPTLYPSGGEKQLIQILTGEEVPAGGLPSDLGLLCQNVGTAAAVQRAVEFGEPLISRVTTVTGHAVRDPGNFDVLLGTPFSHLLERAGLDERALARLVMGGSMMGVAMSDRSTPVVKTTNCLLAADQTDFPDPAPEMPCIRCGMCETACPASLLPQQLYWFARAGDLEAARAHDIADCIECGACAWVCPSAIPLVQYYRHTKGAIRQQDEDARRAERSRERFEHHKARMEAELAEREAKRQARAEAARRKAEIAAAAASQGTDATPVTDARAGRAAVVAAALARAGEHAAAKIPQASSVDSTGNDPGNDSGDVAAPSPSATSRASTSVASAKTPAARIETLRARIDQTRATLAETEAASDGDAMRVSKLQAKLKGMEAKLAGMEAEIAPERDLDPVDPDA